MLVMGCAVTTNGMAVTSEDTTPPLIGTPVIIYGDESALVTVSATDESGVMGWGAVISLDNVLVIAPFTVERIPNGLLVTYSLTRVGTWVLNLVFFDIYQNAAPVPTIQVIIGASADVTDMLMALHDAIKSTSETDWNNPHNSQAMLNKVEELIALAEAGNYAEVYDKLLHDVKPKLTGLKVDENGNTFGDGTFKNQWINNFEFDINSILSALHELF